MLQKLELQLVGILILIYHDVLISVAYLFSKLWICIEYLVGQHQKIIKINKIVFNNILLIPFIYQGDIVIVFKFGSLKRLGWGQ